MDDKPVAVVDLSYVRGVKRGSGLPVCYQYLIPFAAVIEAASNEQTDGVDQGLPTSWIKLMDVLSNSRDWSLCPIEDLLLERESKLRRPLTSSELSSVEETKGLEHGLAQFARGCKGALSDLLVTLKSNRGYSDLLTNRERSAGRYGKIRAAVAATEWNQQTLKQLLDPFGLKDFEAAITRLRALPPNWSTGAALLYLVALCAHPSSGHSDQAIELARKQVDTQIAGDFGSFERSLTVVRLIRGGLTDPSLGLKKRCNHIFDQEYAALAPYADFFFSCDKDLCAFVHALFPRVTCES
jgi:hypothetical protein